MANGVVPALIGVLHDHQLPDQEARFEAAARVGIAAVGDRLDRPIEFTHAAAAGLPRGSAHAVTQAFTALVDGGVLAIVGPAITDNALAVRSLADSVGVPCINYTGGEQTRSEWMFQYQVGSLEEEPVVLAAHLAARGLHRVALVHDRSTIGRRYATFFDDACPSFGVDLVGRAGVSPVAEDVGSTVAALRVTEPDAIVYLGLGLSARPLAGALVDHHWAPPVVGNSALMFGYADPEWAQAWDGWTYVDAVSDDNVVLAELDRELGGIGPGPGAPAAHDLGRLVAEAVSRADHLTREGVSGGLERVKVLPAATGRQGTVMGFGQWERAALKGEYLVLREWRDGVSREVAS